ncbi:Extracellular ligand-binding receptor [Verminephrobacter eiseniae EF01-2]|uniref:Extracellular ligand-binding receptor n=1 Tax=Verminephrobacter eiseniae (strain EF01-2) TaxID=391735 RepID=A1WEM5_VEREI|nr:ABC transporter substrate-binding protein [Verminephrobacter eiseniae]ABM56082.1 Extracellular ligand-binding receptor [Verminephrobacter eiseniae EF01-2]
MLSTFVRRCRGLVPAFAAATFAAATPGLAQDIKIGYISDMSASGAAEFGLGALWGAQQAAQDINAAGGVLGRPLAIVARDDMAQPPKAIQGVTELLDSEKVVALIGSANSGNVLAWLHLPQQKKIPVISPIATATDITKRFESSGENYIFRVSMVDRDQIALLVAYAVKATKNKKIAFLADSTGYGQQGMKDLLAVLKLHALDPVAQEKFGGKDTDMTSQLSKIKAAGADTLIIYGLADANAYVLRSMEKVNYFPVTLGAWGNINTPLLQLAGPALAAKLIFTASSTATSTPKAAALNARLLDKHPKMTAFVTAAQAYDAVLLLATAMKAAGSTQGPQVQQALENLPQVEGIVKTYDKPFGKTNHEALSVADFHLAQWQAGRVVCYDDAITRTITPENLKQ